MNFRPNMSMNERELDVELARARRNDEVNAPLLFWREERLFEALLDDAYAGTRAFECSISIDDFVARCLDLNR